MHFLEFHLIKYWSENSFFYTCTHHKPYETSWIYRFHPLIIKTHIGCILCLKILLFYSYLEFSLKKCVQDSSLTLQVPLRYLIGALHINFKLLWEPLTKLIASHAAGLDKTVFWELYRQTLQDAAHKCGKTKISVVRGRVI